MEYPHLVTSLCYPSCDCSVDRLVFSRSRKLCTRVVVPTLLIILFLFKPSLFLCLVQIHTHDHADVLAAVAEKIFNKRTKKVRIYLDVLVPKHANETFKLTAADNYLWYLTYTIRVILYHAKNYLFRTAGNTVE